MWFVTSQKNGVSALGLQRVLGLGSYETAWTSLVSCAERWSALAAIASGARSRSTRLRTGPEEGKRGRQTEDKAIVVVAAEKSGRG